jgi:hypothetical protein
MRDGQKILSEMRGSKKIKKGKKARREWGMGRGEWG